MPCQWNTARECQFAVHDDEVLEHDGRCYCLYHLPLDNGNKLDLNEFSIHYNKALTPCIGLRDSSGVAFRGHATHGMVATYRVDVEAVFQNCTFGRFATST